MPIKAKNPKSNIHPVRINGIQRIVDSVQEQFNTWITNGNPISDREIEQIAHQISLKIEKINNQISLKGYKSRNLSSRTATALRWLSFFKDPENIRIHLHSLSEAFHHAESLSRKKKGLFKLVGPEVSLQFYSTQFLYKGIHNSQKIKITINEAFIGAPAGIIQDLVHLAMDRREKKRLEAVRLYTRQQIFIQNYTLLTVHQQRFKAPQGKFVDLRDVFKRINHHYFENRLTEPRLGWGSRKSRRKYGHYQEETDTVVINPVLDSPQIPTFVVDFVMYHELLHKDIGTIHVNGRRKAHTPSFRAAEKKFEFYDKAQAALKQISQSM